MFVFFHSLRNYSTIVDTGWRFGFSDFFLTFLMFWNPRNRPLMLNSTYTLNSGYLLGIDWGSNIFPLPLFEHQLISNEVFNLLIDSQTIPTWKITQLQRKLVRRIRLCRPCPQIHWPTPQSWDLSTRTAPGCIWREGFSLLISPKTFSPRLYLRSLPTFEVWAGFGEFGIGNFHGNGGVRFLKDKLW